MQQLKCYVIKNNNACKFNFLTVQIVQVYVHFMYYSSQTFIGFLKEGNCKEKKYDFVFSKVVCVKLCQENYPLLHHHCVNK